MREFSSVKKRFTSELALTLVKARVRLRRCVKIHFSLFLFERYMFRFNWPSLCSQIVEETAVLLPRCHAATFCILKVLNVYKIF
jgi:hypothetical protein